MYVEKRIAQNALEITKQSRVTMHSGKQKNTLIPKIISHKRNSGKKQTTDVYNSCVLSYKGKQIIDESIKYINIFFFYVLS